MLPEKVSLFPRTDFTLPVKATLVLQRGELSNTPCGLGGGYVSKRTPSDPMETVRRCKSISDSPRVSSLKT